jgi:hypothetical protein
MKAKHLFRCPNGHLGRIDDDQLKGAVSIDCTGSGGYEGDTECSFHGYIDDGELVEEDKYA